LAGETDVRRKTCGASEPRPQRWEDELTVRAGNVQFAWRVKHLVPSRLLRNVAKLPNYTMQCCRAAINSIGTRRNRRLITGKRLRRGRSVIWFHLFRTQCSPLIGCRLSARFQGQMLSSCICLRFLHEHNPEWNPHTRPCEEQNVAHLPSVVWSSSMPSSPGLLLKISCLMCAKCPAHPSSRYSFQRLKKLLVVQMCQLQGHLPSTKHGPTALRHVTLYSLPPSSGKCRGRTLTWRQHVPPKRQNVCTRLHAVVTVTPCHVISVSLRLAPTAQR
jgi:hypothetical protein